MALTEQMQEAIREDIADTRSKEERIKDQMAGLKSTGKFLGEAAFESIPGVSEEIATKNIEEALAKGDKVGAAIEAAGGVLGLVPIVGDIAGKTFRKTANSLRKDAKYTVDNPGYNEVYGETYAQTKQKSSDTVKQKAIDRGDTNSYQAKIGSSDGQTGFIDDAKFKPEELKNIPGALGEEKFRDTGETFIDGEKAYNKLEALKKNIAEEGYKPENILIHVREDGQPFIVEGNHRLAEALQSGRETITADIRYLRGAEEVDGPLKPADILPPQKDYQGGKRVFHATSADFNEFDFVRPGESDIGFHVGTSEQANARLRSSGENIREGERVLPLQLKKKLKPARVPDVSFFSEPNRWRAELAVPTSEKNVLRFLLDDAEDADIIAKGPTVRVGGELYVVNPQAARQGATSDVEFWKDLVRASVAAEKKLDTKNFEDKKKWFEVLKGVANKHNYDSFVYKNQYEGSSEAGLDTLVDQIKKASKGDIDPSEVDMLSKFDDSYMLLEPDQAKGLFGGRTSGEPEFMKSKGGLI
mgnify:CR=1 FL=1